MKHFRFPISDFRFQPRFRSVRSVALWLVLVLYSQAPCGEAIYLQSGEEYVGAVERIAKGQLHALIGDKPQAFPLGSVQRIEFQRPRLLDDVATVADLPSREPFFAEVLNPKTDDLRSRFPQAGIVVLADETVVTLRTDGAWEIKQFEAWRILEDRGAESAMRSLTYFPDRQQVEVLFGLTVAPDGTVAHLADTAMKDEALYARLPAYNFEHRLRFTLKGAVPGATFILATARRGKASLLEPFVLDKVFWDEDPALRRSVRLAIEEKARDLVATATANGPKDWGKDGLWEIKDAPQTFREPMMPPEETFAPRLVVAFPKADWPAVARTFAAKADAAASLPTKGVPPRALFDQVRQAIRLEKVPLDAQPDGPAAPAATLVRGYGTPVERALLLAALLRGAGQKADVVLARSRRDGPLLPAAARLPGLTEAVVRLAADGKETWLEADDEDRGFGELDPEVQGGEGLDLTTGQLVAIPAMPPAAEAKTRSVEVELAPDGTALVRESQKLFGHFAADTRGLKDLTEDQRQKWAARYVGGEATGVDLLEFTHSDFNNANAEERMGFRYRVPMLAEKAGSFLILRLPNASVSATDVGRSTRERDLFWNSAEREETSFTVKAPPGYAVYAVGQKLDKKGAGWTLAAEWGGTGVGGTTLGGTTLGGTGVPPVTATGKPALSGGEGMPVPPGEANGKGAGGTGAGGTTLGGTGVPPVAQGQGAQGAVRFHEIWERSALTAPQAAYAAYRDARIARSRLRGEVIIFVKE